MNIEINCREEYYALLNKLEVLCDNVSIAITDDYIGEELLTLLEPYLLGSKWSRKFPGINSKNRIKIMNYRLCKNSWECFRKYSSIFDTEMDMAFYKGKELVCNVVNHEEMCYLEEKFCKE